MKPAKLKTKQTSIDVDKTDAKSLGDLSSRGSYQIERRLLSLCWGVHLKIDADNDNNIDRDYFSIDRRSIEVVVVDEEENNKAG